jgi:ABC-type molybdenum transport system ATPase subunit/photorepair protein PhrA
LESRKFQANTAFKNKCHWILEHDSYRQWEEKDTALLWVMGGPGTGKLTLMAFLLREFESTHPSEVILDFFFHGRGSDLQKAPIGMYRTLLHQLVMKVSRARRSIANAYQEEITKYGTGMTWNWEVKELRDLLLQCLIQVTAKTPIVIFVDALDESAQEAPKLLNYFHLSNDCQQSIKICISCRYFPVACTIKGLDVAIQSHNQLDIETFVRNEMIT